MACSLRERSSLSLKHSIKEITMPVILWLLGVPISLILLFMLIF